MPAVPMFALIFSALVWGLAWWPLRWLDAHGLHALWATSFVYVLPVSFLLAARHAELAAAFRVRGLWALALAAGITNAAFNWGVLVGEVVRVVLLFYLMPVWAIFFARWLLGEKPGAGALLRVGLALAGAATVLWSPQTGLPIPRSLGDWLGLAGGIGFAMNNVLLRRHAGAPAAARAFAMFVGGLCVPGALAAVLTGIHAVAPPPAPATAWLSGTLALACALTLGNLALTYGAARLPANVTAVVTLTEVVFAAGSAVWIGGEPFDTRTLVGGALIVAASLLAGFDARTASRDPAR